MRAGLWRRASHDAHELVVALASLSKQRRKGAQAPPSIPQSGGLLASFAPAFFPEDCKFFGTIRGLGVGPPLSTNFLSRILSAQGSGARPPQPVRTTQAPENCVGTHHLAPIGENAFQQKAIILQRCLLLLTSTVSRFCPELRPARPSLRPTNNPSYSLGAMSAALGKGLLMRTTHVNCLHPRPSGHGLDATVITRTETLFFFVFVRGPFGHISL